MNLRLKVVIHLSIYLEEKIEPIFYISMTNKEKKHIAFHYLLTEIRCTLYFDCFGVEYLPQEALNKMKDKNHSQHITIQSDEDLMCGFHRTSLL